VSPYRHFGVGRGVVLDWLRGNLGKAGAYNKPNSRARDGFCAPLYGITEKQAQGRTPDDIHFQRMDSQYTSFVKLDAQIEQIRDTIL
jgi:hypothetical protein